MAKAHQQAMENLQKQIDAARRKGKMRAALRLANRLAEEWFRQILSWVYQTLGYVALYDRHFLFDFHTIGKPGQTPRLSDRLHVWLLRSLYPRPDLIIFLDAPPEVLMARKGEATLDYLELRRRAFLQAGFDFRQ